MSQQNVLLTLHDHYSLVLIFPLHLSLLVQIVVPLHNPTTVVPAYDISVHLLELTRINKNSFMISKIISPSTSRPTTMANGIIQIKLLSSLLLADAHPITPIIWLSWLLSGTNSVYSQFPMFEDNIPH